MNIFQSLIGQELKIQNEFIPVTEDNLSKVVEAEKRAIEQIENVLETRKNKVACIIIEADSR